MTRTLLVAGAGGVGKTTVAASVAVTAARAGIRTLVVTVDPAQRLATALGLDNLGSEPQPHHEEPNLWAAMLDSSSSWRAVAERHADPEVATRLAENEFFEAAADHFPASQSYAAADQAATYVQAKAWDLVVVDTPPSGGGIDFFTAPAQMADLVGGRLLRWITGGAIPGRRFLYNRAGRPILKIADVVLGSDLLERVAEFLLDLRTTYDGVARRGREIEKVMREAAVFVITTADPAPLHEAVRFYRELPGIAAAPDVVVFNRTLPEAWLTLPDTDSADVKQVAELWTAEALRQRDSRESFAARHEAAIATIPWSPRAPVNLDGLAALSTEATGIPWHRLGID